MITYGICLSLSDLLHLLWSSLVASVLLQMALFHFFQLSSIPFYICTISFLLYKIINFKFYSCFTPLCQFLLYNKAEQPCVCVCVYPLYDKPRQYIEKQRHYSANRGPYSQGCGLPSGHVQLWELDYKRKQNAKELMLLNCGAREDSWKSLGQQGDQTTQS